MRASSRAIRRPFRDVDARVYAKGAPLHLERARVRWMRVSFDGRAARFSGMRARIKERDASIPGMRSRIQRMRARIDEMDARLLAKGSPVSLMRAPIHEKAARIPSMGARIPRIRVRFASKRAFFAHGFAPLRPNGAVVVLVGAPIDVTRMALPPK